MDKRATPEPEQWIQEIETIKVFADPLRLKIIRLMAKPTTVKEIADGLDMAPAKLYYHVNLLLKHGLIQVVDHNLETGIVEKVYQVTARHFKLVNPLIAGADFPAEAADAIFGDMLQGAMLGFQQAFARRDRTTEAPPRSPFLSQKQFRLTDSQLTALHARLDALIKEVTALGHENADLGTPSYELTVVFYEKMGDE